jgi:beta-lactamase superfamily II metal-dependent hydrolase
MARTFAPFALLLLLAAGAARAANTLDIYFIDTEGGQATLLVSPSGQTMMIDTGFAGLDTANPDKEVGRDGDRIAAAARLADVKRIDTLVVSHFHGDHVGGVTQLTERLPVRVFVDDGPAVQDVPILKQRVGEYSEIYAAAFAKGQHKVVKAGDKIPVDGLDVTVVAANGKAIARKGDANPYCEGIAARPEGNPEDTESLGVLVQLGKFRFANFGDMPWGKEVEFSVREPAGEADVLETARHGGEPSKAIYAMAPRVAIADNARGKARPAALKAFRRRRALKICGSAFNAPGGKRAILRTIHRQFNEEGTRACTESPAMEDGSFTRYNPRTKATKAYAAK